MKIFNAHISSEDMFLYANYNEDDFDKISKIEKIQLHLDECQLCKQKMALFMQYDLLFEEELFGKSLIALKNETLLRRRLIAGKVLSVASNDSITKFAKAIAEGQAYVRRFSSANLALGYHPAYRGENIALGMSVCAPDGCIVDAKRDESILSISILSPEKKAYMVVVTPNNKYKLNESNVICEIATYDPSSDRSLLSIEYDNSIEDYEVYIQEIN